MLYFSAGDIAWFMGSMFALASGTLITTVQGVWATVIIALAVLYMGLAQVWNIAERCKAGVPDESAGGGPAVLMPASMTRLGAMGKSWLGMKTWVKIWLFGLNGVFLAGFFFWPDELIRIEMAAYVSSGAVLFAIATWQRGLTRFLGIAHLIPWAPLVAYLPARLLGLGPFSPIPHSEAPALFYYTIILFIGVMICMAFDLYDLVRWFRGDHGRIGATARGQDQSGHSRWRRSVPNEGRRPSGSDCRWAPQKYRLAGKRYLIFADGRKSTMLFRPKYLK